MIFHHQDENRRTMDSAATIELSKLLILQSLYDQPWLDNLSKFSLQFYDDPAVGTKSFGQHGLSEIFITMVKIAVQWISASTVEWFKIILSQSLYVQPWSQNFKKSLLTIW